MRTTLSLMFALDLLLLNVAGGVITVPGDSNLFGAGHALPPAPGGGSGGTLPPVYQLGATDTVVAFAVTGSNTLVSAFGLHGPDGTDSHASDLYPCSGLSGIRVNAAGFLAGVFLGPDEPADPAPLRLNFSSGNTQFPLLMPGLEQTFFIGDGWTGAGVGTRQMFVVPTGATRLFLGFVDGYNFNGFPGQYQDNAGELQVEIQPTTLDTNGISPFIFSEPAIHWGHEGETMTPFQVSVVGTSPLILQWLKDGVPVGGNDSALHLTNVRTNDAGLYTLVVTNLYGAATSAPMRLYVQSSEVTIRFQSEGVTNMYGASSSFFVFATSQLQPLRFQWQFNGVDLPFGTDYILTVTNAQSVNQGTYRVIVSNTYRSVTSAPVTLTLVDHGTTWFANTQFIEIEDDDESFPYPSTIEVLGMAGRITNLTVWIDRLSHDWPDDIDILLVGPHGQSLLLMSDAGGGSPVENVSLRFTAMSPLQPSDGGPLYSGKFRPSNYGGTTEFFPPPAPPGPYGTDLSIFADTDPNGTWRLFVRDDDEDASGIIAGGWSLDFATDGLPGNRDANALDKWHLRHAAITNLPLAVSAFKRGLVAVGNSGAILTSPDGFEWMQQSSGTTFTLNDVTFGEETLVAVGSSGTVLTSPDGTVWTSRQSGTRFQLNDVTFGDGRFVAVGETGTALMSLDAGTTWHAASSGTSLPLNGVTFGQGQFVAVGGNGVMRVSTNGLNWVSALPATNVTLWSVAYGAGQFVAVGGNRTILTSPDGMNWTGRSGFPSTNPQLNDVIYAAGQFVCGGYSSSLASSTDGVSWGSLWFPPSPWTFGILGLAFNGDTLVAAYIGTTNGIAQSDPITLRPPRVARPPRDTVVVLGGTTNVSVAVSGTSPFTYRWQRDGVPIAGATNRMLTFSNTQVSAEGSYRVTVVNALGSIDSTSARLTVGVPPTVVAQPLNQDVIQGGTVTLSIEVDGAAPFSYGWHRPALGVAAVHDYGRQSFWTVTNVQLANVGNYGVYVTNTFGTVVSRAARLSILLDADADGLPDAWETAHGLDTNHLEDASLDLDADGMTNLDEYRSGTNPTNAGSLLTLRSFSTNHAMGLEFAAETNKTYSILYTDPPLFDRWDRLRDFPARTNRRTETVIEPVVPEHRLYRVVTPTQR